MNGGFVGQHALLNFIGVDSAILKDHEMIKKILLDSANKGNFTILNSFFHAFDNHGFTGILLLSESHMSIHTWPEYNYMALDVFSCASSAKLEKTIDSLKSKFKCNRIEEKRLNR